MKKRISLKFLAALVLLTESLTMAQEKRSIKVISYNVGVFTKSEQNSMGQIAQLLSSEEADFIGLCELDSCTIRTGGVFQLEELSRLMYNTPNKTESTAETSNQWPYCYAKAIPFQGGSYGIGILVNPKYKIINTYRLALPKLDGYEARVLLAVETENLLFAMTHLDHKLPSNSIAAQHIQARMVSAYLRALSKATKKAVILCGDFNAQPHSKLISEMRGSWLQISPNTPTYPADKPIRCIDYIFYYSPFEWSVADPTSNSNGLNFQSHVIENKGIMSNLSDHLPLSARIYIP